MKKKQAPREILIYTPFILIMIMSIINATFKFADVKYNKWMILGVILVTMAYLYISSIFKYGCSLIFALFIFPKPLVIFKGAIKLLAMLPSFINSLIENYQVNPEYRSNFQWYMVALTVIIVLIFYLLIVMKKHTIEALILGYGVIGLYFLLGTKDIYKDANLFLLSGLLLYGYNNYERKWKGIKSKRVYIGRGYYTKLLASILSIVIMASFVGAIFPKNRKPADLEWLKNKIFDRFDSIGDGEDSGKAGQVRFSISSTGYQNNPQRLGGAVKLDKSTALVVNGLKGKGAVHLRGTIKDVYNGYMWDKSIGSHEKFTNIYGVSSNGILTEDKQFEIIHKKIKTSTIFNILYPYSIDNSLGYAYYDGDMELYNPKVVKTGKGYKISSTEFEITRDVLLSKTSKTLWKPSKDLIRYMQLSSTVPQRVYDLTDKITKEYSSPYEKVSAIENYLKENYRYDLNTSQLPEGKDFVDYFLFQEKKGYCTYFASAMTVMCRIAGIPARYVEGFLISSSESDKEKIDVLNSDAHAWVEIYFDNVGWVTFDPTPGNESLALDLDTAVAGEKNNNDDNSSTPQENQNDKNETKNPDIPEEDDIQAATQDNSWIKIVVLCAEIAGITLLVLLAILIVLYTAQFKLLKKGKIAIAFSIWKIMFYGKLLDHIYKNGETIREYVERLGFFIGRDYSSYISICESSIYGKNKLTEKERRIIKETVYSIKGNAEKNIGRFKFRIRDFWNFLIFYVKNIKNCR